MIRKMEVTPLDEMFLGSEAPEPMSALEVK